MENYFFGDNSFFLSLSNSLFISCLMFIIRSIVIRIRFLSIRFNWLIYSIIILYLGGIIILFMYICRISSVSKIETESLLNSLLALVRIFIFLKLFFNLNLNLRRADFRLIYSLYSLRGQIILVLLRLYLIIGLLARIFFVEKLQGPLKPFYDKWYYCFDSDN